MDGSASSPSSDDEVEGEEEDHEAVGNYLRRARAAYLLRIKETHNLTQTAVNDIVMNTKMLIRDAVETTCETMVKKLWDCTGEDYSEQVGWEVLSDENAGIANPFQGMETENGQRQTFRELFGLVVSIKYMCTRRREAILATQSFTLYFEKKFTLPAVWRTGN